jgi:hypothetical protein
MRIRSAFLLGFTAVGIPGLLASGWLATIYWSDWKRAEYAGSVAHSVGDIQRAQTAFAVEIGLITAAALAPNPDLGALGSAQAVTDGVLEAARKSVAGIRLDTVPVADAAAALVRLRGQLAP